MSCDDPIAGHCGTMLLIQAWRTFGRGQQDAGCSPTGGRKASANFWVDREWRSECRKSMARLEASTSLVSRLFVRRASDRPAALGLLGERSVRLQRGPLLFDERACSSTPAPTVAFLFLQAEAAGQVFLLRLFIIPETSSSALHIEHAMGRHFSAVEHTFHDRPPVYCLHPYKMARVRRNSRGVSPGRTGGSTTCSNRTTNNPAA